MTDKQPLVSDRTYNVLSNFVKLVLPALGTAYFAIAAIWGLPYGEQVLGTLAALAILGGTLLVWAKNRYEASDEKYDGEVGSDGIVYLNTAGTLVNKDSVLLKTPPSP